MFSIKRWWQTRILEKERIDDSLWENVVRQLPLLSHYTPAQLGQLRELATLFLHYKTIVGAGDLEITQKMRVIISAQACIPILNLGIDWYDGWYSVIVYPAGFVPNHTYTDEAGVVHETHNALDGESWQQGPVILSWEQTEHAGQIDGRNLVIHEFAHKLDMLNGAANGLPPLHRDMKIETWANAFNAAYSDFQYRLDRGHPTEFDRYGGTAPAEFFAVLSEVFFELPHTIQENYPEVYEQLCLFYRQRPFAPTH